jgi:hypothetical protein
MHVRLDKDRDDGVWTLYQQASILTAADLVDWRERIVAALEPLEERVDLLVDLSGLTLHPSIASLFALVASDELVPRSKQLFHYGASPGTAAALRLAYSYLRLYPDRISAVVAADALRRDRMILRRSGTLLTPSAADREMLEVCIREKKG